VLRSLVAFEIHEDCGQAVEVARAALEQLSHRVEESQPAALDDAELTQHFLNFVTSWTAAALNEWGLKLGRTLGQGDVEPSTRAMAELGRTVTAAQYVATLEALSRYTRQMASWWSQGFDVLVTPTIATPPPLGELCATADDPLSGLGKTLPIAPFTGPFNITGQPAISLPLHWNRGGYRSACSWSPPTAARTSSFASPHNSRGRSPGRTAVRRFMPERSSRRAGTSRCELFSAADRQRVQARAAADRNRRAVDERGAVGREEGDEIADLARFAESACRN
jgi:Amidase